MITMNALRANFLLGMACSCLLFLGACVDDEQPIYNPIHIGEPDFDDDDGGNSGDEDEDVDIDLSKWELIWEEEFEGTDETVVNKNWEFDNTTETGNILCSRWRDNGQLSGEGTFKLVAKHETRGGDKTKPYTAASCWTREKFKYGYFECRYKYAGATGTNNSFWIMDRPAQTFEIDINEGHYPNEINTNIHKWSLPQKHSTKSFLYKPQVKSAYSYSFDNPTNTKKIRLRAEKSEQFQIREIRVYEFKDTKKYPENLEKVTSDDELALGVNNIAAKAKITVSGSYEGYEGKTGALTDMDAATWWTTNSDKGEKWIVLEWFDEINIGCVQFLNGWMNNGAPDNLLDNYKLEYWNGQEWVEFASMDVKDSTGGDDLTKFHTYGLEWNEDELIFYMDRKILRRTKNEWCHAEAPILLSLAILDWAGTPIPEEIDGKFMEVDYVRVYKQ